MPLSTRTFVSQSNCEKTSQHTEANLSHRRDRVDCACAGCDLDGVPVLLSAGLRSIVFLSWSPIHVCWLVLDWLLYSHNRWPNRYRFGSHHVGYGTDPALSKCYTDGAAACWWRLRCWRFVPAASLCRLDLKQDRLLAGGLHRWRFARWFRFV